MAPIFARIPWVLCVLAVLIVAPQSAQAGVCVYPDSTLACLEEVDSTLIGSKTPLILIHGWNKSGIPGDPLTDTWSNLKAYFASNGNAAFRSAFKVYEFSYSSNVVDVATLAVALRDVLAAYTTGNAAFGSKQIVIVGHSMGGLIARYFLRVPQADGSFRGSPGGERVALLVTLGTPHHGSPLANGPAMTDPDRLDAISRQLWLRINDLFYLSFSPRWWEVNRSDLRWDNFDGVLDYSLTYASERNHMLEELNADSRYDSKIIAYGSALGACSVILHPIACGFSTIVANVFGVASDGFVPISSALSYRTPTGDSRFRTRYFSDYDHTEIASGKDDGVLFWQLREDLLAAVPTDGRGMDNYADLGNPDDERFQNLRGWGSINPGLLPIGIDIDRTSRYQAIRGESSVDLRVVRSSRGYLLTFRVEDGACDDSFEVFVNERTRVVNYRHGSAGQQFPLHRVEVSSAVIEGDIAKVTFINRARDDCGRAAVYFVRIDPL